MKENSTLNMLCVSPVMQLRHYYIASMQSYRGPGDQTLRRDNTTFLSPSGPLSEKQNLHTTIAAAGRYIKRMLIQYIASLPVNGAFPGTCYNFH